MPATTRRRRRTPSLTPTGFSLPFILSAMTSALQNAVGPTGAANSAYTTVEDATNAAHTVATTPTAIASGDVLTRSIYIKANGRTKGQIYVSTNGGGANRAGCNFDLGAITATTFASGAGVANFASIQQLSQPGWFKLTINGAQNGGDLTSALVLRHADGTGALTYLGDGVSGFLIY